MIYFILVNNTCIFCRIISGTVPAYRLWENENTIAFLDAYPVTQGHTLVVPKKHYPSIEDLSADGLDVLSVLPFLVRAVRTITGADAINVWQNNGKPAGQHVDHVHFHIVPRYSGDALFRYPAPGQLDPTEAQAIVQRFRGEMPGYP